MAQVPQTFFDALAVRTWCGLALGAIGRAREEIDAINVYPVADGDTGTNLYLTVESAAGAVEAVFAGYELGEEVPTLADAVRATGPVDIVDVFRRPDLTVAHAREAVEVGARCFWLQQGIANEEAGRIAHDGGLSVVMDRCTAVAAWRVRARG